MREECLANQVELSLVGETKKRDTIFIFLICFLMSEVLKTVECRLCWVHEEALQGLP